MTATPRDMDSAANLLNVLKQFEEVSGLTVNKEKTHTVRIAGLLETGVIVLWTWHGVIVWKWLEYISHMINCWKNI